MAALSLHSSPGVNDVWDVIGDQQLFKQGLRRVRLPTRLQENVHYGTGFINGPPQPMFPATDLDEHLVQEPPRTPASPLGDAALG